MTSERWNSPSCVDHAEPYRERYGWRTEGPRAGQGQPDEGGRDAWHGAARAVFKLEDRRRRPWVEVPDTSRY
ncbi:MAG: hypothetical protein ACLSVD_00575 [Eggerthellaceae bacterium]